MKLIYMSPNYIPLTHHIASVMKHEYTIPLILLFDNTFIDSLRHPYVIVKLFKDSDRYVISSMIGILGKLRDISVVETQYHYYLSIPLKVIAELIFENEPETLFAEDLYKVTSKDFINVYEPPRKLDCKSKEVIEYTYRYMTLLTDMRTLNVDYMNLLAICDDLSKDQLNELIRVTVSYTLPIDRLLSIYSNKNIIVDSNNECLYNDTHHNEFLRELDSEYSKELSVFLSQLSTTGGINIAGNAHIEFRTNTEKILTFLYDTMRSYDGINNEISSLTPISTVADTFVTLSLNDINRLSKTITEIGDLKNLLLHRNKYLAFALDDIIIQQLV